MATGVDGELQAAVRRAYANLLDWMTDGFGLNRWDAYNLMSQSGSLVIGGLGLPPHAVAAAILLEALPSSVRDSTGWPADV
jgi:acetamidase/formamidase